MIRHLLPLLAAGLLHAGDSVLVHVSGQAPTITCFRLDPLSGSLTPASTSPAGKSPIALAWSPDRDVLYGVQAPWNAAGRIIAYRCDPGDGSLTSFAEVPSGGVLPCHLAVHPNGRWLFAAHYISGELSVLPIRPDGAVGEPATVLVGGKKAHMAALDPAGRFLLVPYLGSDHLAVYRFDASSGAVTAHDPPTVALPPGSGPRHLAFHAGGRQLTVINELNSTLTTFSYDPELGRLADPRTIPTLPDGWTGTNSGAQVAVSPDGAWLYASNRGHESILACRIAAGTGSLTPVRHIAADGLVTPTDFTLDATGTLLLAPGQKSALLSVFRLDPGDGAPTRLGVHPTGAGPTCVVLRPASVTSGPGR